MHNKPHASNLNKRVLHKTCDPQRQNSFVFTTEFQGCNVLGLTNPNVSTNHPKQLPSLSKLLNEQPDAYLLKYLSAEPGVWPENLVLWPQKSLVHGKLAGKLETAIFQEPFDVLKAISQKQYLTSCFNQSVWCHQRCIFFGFLRFLAKVLPCGSTLQFCSITEPCLECSLGRHTAP